MNRKNKAARGTQYEPYEAEPAESAAEGQPALPRRTGARALPIVLAAVIVVSAVVTLLSVLAAPAGLRRAAGEDAVRPAVVGVADTGRPADSAAGPETEPSGAVLAVSPTPEPADRAPSETGELSLQEIYSRTIGSVVCVKAAGTGASSVGTGVILSSDGYLITNYHVVEGMLEYSILLSDDSEYPARLVGGDEQTDLAVLKIEAEGLQAAVFGDSDSLRAGDTVVAIGNPLGTELRGTMTNGIVSAINRDIVIDGREMTVIQTNAALNSGSSGGPLINIYGQVVGINTAKFSTYYSGTVEGIGFAIPIAAAKPIIDELISLGYVSGRPSLGITGDSVPQYAQIYYRLPDGVYVASVDESSDTYASGVREGDIIVELGGVRVTSASELNAAKNQYQAGDTVTLTVYRGGSYYYVDVVLGEMGRSD